MLLYNTASRLESRTSRPCWRPPLRPSHTLWLRHLHQTNFWLHLASCRDFATKERPHWPVKAVNIPEFTQLSVNWRNHISRLLKLEYRPQTASSPRYVMADKKFASEILQLQHFSYCEWQGPVYLQDQNLIALRLQGKTNSKKKAFLKISHSKLHRSWHTQKNLRVSTIKAIHNEGIK